MHSGCPCSSSGWPPCKCGSPPSPWCRKSWHHMWHNPRTHCGCQWLHMSFRLNLTGHHSHCLILGSLVLTMMTPAELNWWLPGVFVHGDAGHVKGEQRKCVPLSTLPAQLDWLPQASCVFKYLERPSIQGMLEPKWDDCKSMRHYLHKRVYVQHANQTREHNQLPGK